MRKHIAVTVILVLIVSVILAGFFWWRNQLGEERKASEPNRQETEAQEQTEVVNQAEDQTEEPPGTKQGISEGTETEEENASDITMIFTGDVLFANSFSASYDSGGIENVVSEDVREELNQADITMVNEEFPFSTRGTPMEDKQYTFRADPAYVTALLEMGVDIVTLANNHILDYGKDALTDTFTTLDHAGIKYAGAGASAERAKELQTIEVQGRKIGFLAASRVIPVSDWNVDNSVPGVFTTYDGTALCNAVEEAEQLCDYVVVFVHWGVENEAYPQDYQESLAKQYIDAGADLVIGCHTHCLQGVEYYNGKPIYYSLGNFIFGSEIDRSMAVKVTLHPDSSVECRLVPVYAAAGRTEKMSEEDAASLYQYLESISDGIAISKDGVVQEK